MTENERAAAMAELRSNECADSIQREALDRACTIVAESQFLDRLDGLDLFVVDPATASSELRHGDYFTDNCAALFRESAIVVNLRFLAEIEAVIRAFAAAGSMYGMPQLRSDQAIFDLVRNVRQAPPQGLARRGPPDPWPYLKRVRRLTSGYGAPTREGDREEDLRQELSLVILFFLAHEVGHLLDGKDERSFGSFLPPGADLEDRVANAVVKLARHVDEFESHEHGLPGFEDMADPNSKVRASVAAMAGRLGDVRVKHEEMFADENSADEWANRLIDEHLAAVAAENGHEAARTIYLLSRGIFAAGLYSWYADLLAFCDALGTDHLPDARSLTFAMMQDRRHYIGAASLFGPIHRCTLLRAEIALEAVLQTRTDWFEHTDWTRNRLDAPGPEEESTEALEKWWLEETVLRYCLLGIVVDTAVKIAYVGAASSWFEQQPGRGAQLLIMIFDSIDQAVSRLSRGGRA